MAVQNGRREKVIPAHSKAFSLLAGTHQKNVRTKAASLPPANVKQEPNVRTDCGLPRFVQKIGRDARGGNWYGCSPGALESSRRLRAELLWEVQPSNFSNPLRLA